MYLQLPAWMLARLQSQGLQLRSHPQKPRPHPGWSLPGSRQLMQAPAGWFVEAALAAARALPWSLGRAQSPRLCSTTDVSCLGVKAPCKWRGLLGMWPSGLRPSQNTRTWAHARKGICFCAWGGRPRRGALVAALYLLP